MAERGSDGRFVVAEANGPVNGHTPQSVVAVNGHPGGPPIEMIPDGDGMEGEDLNPSPLTDGTPYFRPEAAADELPPVDDPNVGQVDEQQATPQAPAPITDPNAAAYFDIQRQLAETQLQLARQQLQAAQAPQQQQPSEYQLYKTNQAYRKEYLDRELAHLPAEKRYSPEMQALVERELYWREDTASLRAQIQGLQGFQTQLTGLIQQNAVVNEAQAAVQAALNDRDLSKHAAVLPGAVEAVKSLVATGVYTLEQATKIATAPLLGVLPKKPLVATAKAPPVRQMTPEQLQAARVASTQGSANARPSAANWRATLPKDPSAARDVLRARLVASQNR